MNLRLCLACLTVLVLLAGCDAQSDDGAGTEAEGIDSTDVEIGGERDEAPDYRVVLTGALVDTLQGGAIFGEVFQVATRSTETIIELEAGSDFTGGFFITVGDTTLPRPGTYDLAMPAEGDTITPVSPYRIIYRRGLILNVESVQGSLTFQSVSDSLIQGSFNALLQGDVPIPGAGVQPGEVRAIGEFAARPGPVGFIIGLQ